MSENDLLVKAFYWAVDHPTVANFLFWGWICGTAIVTFVRAVYPQYETRPAWAKGVVEVADLFAGNVWRVVGWFFAKLGIQIHTPDEPLKTRPGGT